MLKNISIKHSESSQQMLGRYTNSIWVSHLQFKWFLQCKLIVTFAFQHGSYVMSEVKLAVRRGCIGSHGRPQFLTVSWVAAMRLTCHLCSAISTNPMLSYSPALTQFVRRYRGTSQRSCLDLRKQAKFRGRITRRQQEAL